MKKILLTLATFIAITGFAGKPLVYTPSQVTPVDSAVRQMPDAIVNWNAVTGSINLTYEVMIDTTADFNSPLKIDAVQKFTSYHTSNLLFGTRYYWKVRAIDGSDVSYWSPVWSFVVFSDIDLYKPTNGGSDQEPNVSLLWKSTINLVTITGITAFEYQYDTTQNFNSPLLFEGTAENDVYTVATEGLRFGTTYYWRARARHALDISDWTAPFSFTTLDKITLTSPVNNATNQMLDCKLKWNDIGGILSYKYQIAKDPDFTDMVVETETDTFAVNASMLQFGVKYYWRVAARNLSDTSGWVTPFNFTTINSVVTLLPANNAVEVNTLPLFQWTAQTGITGYQLQVSPDAGFTNLFLDYTTNDPTKASYQLLKSLSSKTTYYWRMRAFSDGTALADTSDWSNTWSFTTTYGLGIDETVGTSFKLSPNPAGDRTLLRVTLAKAAEGEISIMDLVGKTVLSMPVELKSGNNSTEIALDNLRSGVYVVRLNIDGKTMNQKLIIK
ncbi:MAG TPA: T9SS type A sorting domain-containing protein [Bacteroidales bacterium]|nr:T9SS type A sorting domain-containing protein [Bacteroidales bacterium]